MESRMKRSRDSRACYKGRMRLVAVVSLVGCYSATKPPPAPPVPISNETRGCGEAAAGLERGTRGIRPPDVPVLGTMRSHCQDDAWPAAAIDCFATMTEGDLGRCAALVPDQPRERMFAALGGGYQDRTAVAIALAKLSTLKVGIAECDRFVSAVAHLLVCDAMPIEQRAQLGAETADFWSLPTSGLPADAQRKMTEVCGRSLASLQQQAVGAGCMP
jgi:hypothetical protein